ncbi:YncE family protein [Geopsychrobacter electrodiphilus]|uniref:YncE family protein n=1 Tax=Geopsychrobacter electrodiphilus TaxID=225196 RepID=UPI000366D811|nr:hypothetical protein [Geopsychrobacter electrodiphilus]
MLRLNYHGDLKYLLIGLCLLSLVACSFAVPAVTAPKAALDNLTLFLQPLPQEAHRLTIHLAELVALRVDGGEIALPLALNPLVADDLIDAQTKLSGVSLPIGLYRGLALRIAAVELLGEEGQINLLPPPERLTVEYPFQISKDQSEILYLSLAADRLITDGAIFTPRFSLWQPERVLLNLKGFVSNSGASSLTVFNKRTVEVLGILRMGETPRDLLLDQARGWLYVALSGENAIVVVDLNTGNLLGRVALRFGDQPSKLALTPGGKTLLALNPGSNTVSLIDPQSLFETGRINLLSEPNGLIAGADDTHAYVTLANNSLTVLDLKGRQIQRTVPLNEAPMDGVISRDGRTLFLINRFSADLTVFDLASLTTSRKIYVGNGALSLKADGSTGLIYIGKQDGGIAVVDPRSLSAVDAFSLDPEPVQAITIDEEENALFAVQPNSRTLIKLDLVSKKVLGRLTLEAGSHDVVVMGER